MRTTCGCAASAPDRVPQMRLVLLVALLCLAVPAAAQANYRAFCAP